MAPLLMLAKMAKSLVVRMIKEHLVVGIVVISNIVFANKR